MKYKLHYGQYLGDYLQSIDFEIISSPDYYKNLKELLKLKKTNIPLIRLGNKGDGGYVMLDNFNSKIAYSFGIDNDVTWDLDMAKLGYDVYMYDPTIDMDTRYTQFHFHKIGIDSYNHDCYKTLHTLLEENNHKENMILKMDVEGYEWNFLETVGEEINLFDQIILEIHNIIVGDEERNLRLLDKLNKTHQLIHIHGNNASLSLTSDYTITDVIECTYVKRDYALFDYTPTLPIELDYPNDPGRPDVILGKWD